jgi:hypothetical protein
MALARLCELEHKVRSRTANQADAVQHRQYLMSFGFTPADRSRIASMAPATDGWTEATTRLASDLRR